MVKTIDVGMSMVNISHLGKLFLENAFFGFIFFLISYDYPPLELNYNIFLQNL